MNEANHTDPLVPDPAIQNWCAILDQGVASLPPDTRSALYDRRRQALACRPAAENAVLGGGVLVMAREHPAWVMGLMLILALATWLLAFPPYNLHSDAADTADLDIELLTGELPPQVFADWSLVTRENVEAVCLSDS